jgi:hypothetical protein
MAIPPPETAAVTVRDDAQVPLARRRRALMLALALAEILFLSTFFAITLATEADAKDAFGHAHSQVMLMVSLVAMPGALVRFFALLLARASLFSALLASAICARAVWIVITGVVLSVVGQVICLFNANAAVPSSMVAVQTRTLVNSVVWGSVIVMAWSLVIGALQCWAIRAACVAAIRALEVNTSGTRPAT